MLFTDSSKSRAGQGCQSDWAKRAVAQGKDGETWHGGSMLSQEAKCFRCEGILVVSNDLAYETKVSS